VTRAHLIPVSGEEARTAGDRMLLATRLALGLATISAEGLADVARTSIPASRPRVPGRRVRASRAAREAAAQASKVGTRATSHVRAGLDPLYRRASEEQRWNRALAQVFWRALLARVVASVLREVDLNAVIDQVDLDRAVERLDVDAIVARVDFERVARQALDQVDIEEIVRESTAGLADETVDALRAQGMTADRIVSSAVDRLLRRREPRRTGL
jgi:hypothetical protein